MVSVMARGPIGLNASDKAEPRGTCFVAMPIKTHDHEATQYGDSDHWSHVYENLFEPAIRAAGFEPIRPVAAGAHVIHGSIIKRLSESDLVV